MSLPTAHPEELRSALSTTRLQLRSEEEAANKLAEDRNRWRESARLWRLGAIGAFTYALVLTIGACIYG